MTKQALIEHFMRRATAGDKQAVLELLRMAATPDTRLHWGRVLMDLDIAVARKYALTFQTRLGTAQPCSACGNRPMRIWPAETSAAAIIPDACRPLALGTGCCRLCVDAWIKRPDGTSYLDRRPRPQN